MQKTLNFFRGSIRVEISCPYPERFINVCAQNNVEFWDLKRLSKGAAAVTVYLKGYRKLASLSEVAGFSIRPVKRAGVPFFLWKIRKRYALLAGMVICLLGVWTLSLFVWEIDVKGNEAVPAAEILNALSDMGIGIGSFGPSIVNEQVSNEILQVIPELSFITVNVHGSHADVIVRERIPVPQVVDEDTPTMIEAMKSGIITKMSVFEGKKVCAIGDTVTEGDILVTGILDSLSSGMRIVHASAEIYARTWYALSCQMPLDTFVKDYTDEKETKTALIIGGKRINFYFNSGNLWPCYDKITMERNIQLPTGNILPIVIVQETYTEYEKEAVTLSRDEAEKILEKQLLLLLGSLVTDGEITDTQFEAALQEGVLTVTLKAECLEQIAKTREMTQEEQRGIEEEGKEQIIDD